MKLSHVLPLVLILTAPNIVLSQSESSFSSSSEFNSLLSAAIPAASSSHVVQKPELTPFSRLALGVGISLQGITLQATTNVDKYLNVRAAGNVFQYSTNNISTNGLNADAQLSFASAGVSLDVYPFPHHGLRISPGILFYNQNELSGTVVATSGSSFTLNDNNYVSSSTNPVTGAASISFHKQNPAFTITTGWGNQISRTGGHLSFPVEIGIALTGDPTVQLALTSGQVCDFEGNCQNVTTDAALQSDLKAQIAKYNNDLNPLKVYPIVSFGIAYNFKIR